VSITLEAAFCVEALEEALARHDRPETFNTNQGSQFTSHDFTGVLLQAGIAISMDGKGRCRGALPGDPWAKIGSMYHGLCSFARRSAPFIG
jgi:putative transposase